MGNRLRLSDLETLSSIVIGGGRGVSAAEAVAAAAARRRNRNGKREIGRGDAFFLKKKRLI